MGGGDGGRKSRCLTTLVSIMLGPDKDAAVIQMRKQVLTWFQVWQSYPSLHAKTHKAWGDYYGRTRCQANQAAVAAGLWACVRHGVLLDAVRLDSARTYGMVLSAGEPLDVGR